jgi:prevent-host-death family protein
VDEVVSAAEAKRRISELLRGAREGRRFVVTSHGKPVARILPVEPGEGVAPRAKELLLERLRAQPVRRVGRWTRDELYENEP